MNNVSVWWHVVGAAAIVLILHRGARPAPVFSYVFTERFNNSGYDGGSTSASGSGSSIVPFGFLLTQYTITGFDASAHLSEETDAASHGGRQGHLAVDLLLGPSAATSCCCASCSRSRTTPTGCPTTRLARLGVASSSRGLGHQLGDVRAVHLRLGQFFCATSCMTSASRMTFAFSRDGAIPGFGDSGRS